MSEAVKRYDIGECQFIGGFSKMLEDEAGEWVLAADHDRIVAELRGDLEASDKLMSQSRDRNSRLRKERDTLRAEVERLRKDAERYRFVRELAWYVDQAAFIYEVGNSRSPWSSERAPIDADDIEEAIDAALEASR